MIFLIQLLNVKKQLHNFWNLNFLMRRWRRWSSQGFHYKMSLFCLQVKQNTIKIWWRSLQAKFKITTSSSRLLSMMHKYQKKSTLRVTRFINRKKKSESLILLSVVRTCGFRKESMGKIGETTFTKWMALFTTPKIMSTCSDMRMTTYQRSTSI